MAWGAARFSDVLALDRDRPSNYLANFKSGVFHMWEQLTPADIERVRHRMIAQRGESLKRHAEELKALDAEQAEIAAFERLVAAFAKKHLSSAAQSSGSAMTTEKEAPAVVAIDNGAGDPLALEETREDASSPLQVIHQQPSPNFAIGPRLRRFGP